MPTHPIVLDEEIPTRYKRHENVEVSVRLLREDIECGIQEGYRMRESLWIGLVRDETDASNAMGRT
jgi:hypothetical protein